MRALVARALVAGVRPAGAYTVLALQAPEVARATRPGQFIEVRLDPDGEHLLRRPFSVYRAHPAEGLLEVAFDVVGEGTRWIAARPACTEVEILGPLGRPFDLPSPGSQALLVGGGYGSAALAQLGAGLRQDGSRATLIAGAATASRVFAPDPHLFDRVVTTTEDGSAGIRGLVTDAMEQEMTARPPVVIYACGPMRMLAAVAERATTAGVSCQVAAEEFMACGVGVCWTCVVPVRAAGGIALQRCCTEGPVFDGAAVAW